MTITASHRTAFLQAILERPEDDAPRLIMADWLEENGEEARAEFIRVQCELAKYGDNMPENTVVPYRQIDALRTWHIDPSTWPEFIARFLGAFWRSVKEAEDFISQSAIAWAKSVVSPPISHFRTSTTFAADRDNRI